ncbi:MAG TPA: ABC transporter substrate-binding protein, partial [Xanthobacteraceae bacterium]|nr:ABC transporter substrate-binding protein [Xanthobacteraceae bacterium]
MRLTRRSVVRTGVLTALSPILGGGRVPFLGSAARAQESSPAGNAGRDWKHGLSLFGQLKYPPGFKHFD